MGALTPSPVPEEVVAFQHPSEAGVWAFFPVWALLTCPPKLLLLSGSAVTVFSGCEARLPPPAGFPSRGDRLEAAAAPPPHSIPYMEAERGAAGHALFSHHAREARPGLRA